MHIGHDLDSAALRYAAAAKRLDQALRTGVNAVCINDCFVVSALDFHHLPHLISEQRLVKIVSILKTFPLDNRISKYAGQCGKCYVTEKPLKFDEVHCHHIKPLKLEGNDNYDNLVIVHTYIHTLIHATKAETITQYLQLVGKENINIKKLNKLREAVGNQVLTLDIY